MGVRGRRKDVGVGAMLAALLALLAGGLALQLGSGGIRSQSLSPAVLALTLTSFGAAILVRRPGLAFGPLLCVNGVGFGVGFLAAGALDYAGGHAVPRLAEEAAFAAVWATVALVAAWTLFILWFPDARLPGRGWRRFFAGACALTVAFAVAGWLGADDVFGFYTGTAVPVDATGPLGGALGDFGKASTVLLALPLAALASLVQRHRHGGPVLRRQVRWLLVGIGTQIAGQITGAALLPLGGTAYDVGVAVGAATQPLPMLAATLAILRHRLWEIELVVSRALVYAALWAALSALLLVPPLAAGLLVGGRGAAAAVGIALLVTAVFQPTRTRLERLAERLVYRHRARPYVLLTGFWETLRTAGLDELGPLLADALRDGLGVRWAGAWMVTHGSLVPLGVSGAEPGPPLPVPPDVAEQLRGSPGLVLAGEPPALWPEPPAAVVPLVAADELVGVLACGPRPGDALGDRDFELLELLARECGLRLRNLRLEAELRERLAEIEAQADELRRSRQRLVTAQDEERRRIERNLHDGVQQQLVSLAVRLRRAAGAGGPLLADLAAEAEQTVFELQELGRGIFPSVLADQGLPAALRAQAARTPLPVRLQLDDALLGRRFDPELEAAVYYVALEALANAQKHAQDASVELWLRLEDGELVLDVADDGPGLDGRGRAGTGLQNMADRIAAAGGRLTVDGGAGTRVTARVPLAEAGLQPAAADSRR